MKLIISNHKNNKIYDIDFYKKELEKLSTLVDFVVCPREDDLELFVSNFFKLGSQDILENNTLINYTIVGHKDRRTIDSNVIINKKIIKLLSIDITPILCVGNDKDEDVLQVIKKQLDECLYNVNGNIIIAYEPNWSINTGIIPNNDELYSIIEYIKDYCFNILGYRPTVLYGGSVNGMTISNLGKIYNIDGYLIGNASLDINEIKRIVEVLK